MLCSLVLALVLLVSGVALAEPAASEPGGPETAAVEVAAVPEEDVRAIRELDARALIKYVDDIFRGTSAQMKASMTIVRPRWTRTVTMRWFDDRVGDRSFIRILNPAKDRGTGFLREGQTFWTYLPRIERTTRIPPSMMLQPWMGSDFTNDDLVRESSLIDDYDPSDLEPREIDGVQCRGLLLLPHEEAPVVWARIEYWIDAQSLVPVRAVFYDEVEPGTFEALRHVYYRDVREVQGRPLPHDWEMVPLDKEGQSTRLVLEEAIFDEPIDDSVFTMANLKRVEAAR